MRKQIKGRKFNRETAQRKALLRALICAVVLEEKVKTTEIKAKEVSGFVEKYITKAKKGDLACRRLLARYLNKGAVKKIVDEIAPKYKGRKGGYTRIIKLGPRKSDGAKMAIIELVK
ncbi:50S ribosomal protein L17 [Candidatus Parcubacteria bacterium]|nr:50S ribosomal protein L17 [Candidatus Parcubacteria bacterium]